MTLEDEIERLRAAVIVDSVLLESMLESMPRAMQTDFAQRVRFKLEHFTARTLNSSMPEAFAAAQSTAAEAWLTVLARNGL